MGDEVKTLDSYTIYQYNGYYICVANREINNYQMFIGFPNKDFLTLSKDEVVSEIKKVSDLIFSRSSDVIYVMPIIKPSELEMAASINDDKGYNRILEKIRVVTSEIYQLFAISNKRINNIISMVKQNDIEQKIIHWIDMKLMKNGVDYVQEVDIKTLMRHQRANDTNQYFEEIEPQQVFNSDIAPINRETEVPVQSKQNMHVRKLVKPKTSNDVSPGFSSMKFIVMILSITILAGVAVAAWLIK